MVRPNKPSSKKQPKSRGVDFKKIKRKLGRKLPPAKNSTNTEIKSKAIVLPEQSVASDRVGLAVSKKGLTLKELLQQTSHHNANVRKDALIGIKDITLKHPEELKLHKLAIIGKLRERISDEDKVVRETLYNLLKTVIFPGTKEDIPGPFISLIMAYISNAMTHLAVDIRLMAFTFFDLVVQHYPSSFLSHAEEVLQNYGDVLGKNYIYLQDRNKLKNVLVGLVRCLSLLPVNRKVDSSDENSTNARRTLHAFETEAPKEHTDVSFILKTLSFLLPVLVNCFQELTPSVRVMAVVDAQSFDCMSCVLQSIDLAVKFFVHGIYQHQTGVEITVPFTDKGKDVIPMILTLLKVFPLSPTHRPTEKIDERYFVLNVGIAEIFLQLTKSIDAPALVMEKFLLFIESALSGQILCNTRSGKSVREKHLVSLLPFIPRLVSQVESDWKCRLLQAFTKTFVGCKPDSSLHLACVSSVEEMLLPSHGKITPVLDTSDPEIAGYPISWIQELPMMLVRLGDKHPSSSKIVLHLLLRLGQHSPMNPALAWEYDNMQNALREFYGVFIAEAENKGDTHYGPFINLPRDCQELAICSLYYFSHLDPHLLQSLASCCLYNNLEPLVLFRIMEVLHSSYKAGHIQIADHISFFVTLLVRFKVLPEFFYHVMEGNEKISNHGTFKDLTDEVCSCLSQVGDDALVLQMLQKILFNEMSLNLQLDNKRAMLKLLSVLDSKPTRLREESISHLANPILQYLIDVASYIPENSEDESNNSIRTRICQYYLIPCFFLFDRSHRLLSLVLNLMASSIGESSSSVPPHDGTVYAFDKSSRITAIACIIQFMHKDVKFQRVLSSYKAEIRLVLQNLQLVQASNETNMNLEERHKVRLAFIRLETATGLKNAK